jgi:hypothetical protein
VSEIHVLFGARQVLSSFSFRILEMLGKTAKREKFFCICRGGRGLRQMKDG